jgi:hypothetical protein
VVLIALQGALDVSLSREGGEWNPSLAWLVWRPHRPVVLSADDPAPPRMPVAFLPLDFHSERAMSANGPRGIVTLVCLTCGKEKFFTQEVPASVTCEQCGSTVFRSFATPTEPDDAAIDALEVQARSMAYGDSSPDTTSDDVRDLDAR